MRIDGVWVGGFGGEILPYGQDDYYADECDLTKSWCNKMRSYYVYILASHSRTLYTGMTNDLERRMYEHKNNLIPGFTTQYRINRLVYFEAFDTPLDAIEAEKRLKGWTRAKKVALIQQENPTWRDLSEGWELPDDAPPQRSPTIEAAGSNPTC